MSTTRIDFSGVRAADPPPPTPHPVAGGPAVRIDFSGQRAADPPRAVRQPTTSSAPTRIDFSNEPSNQLTASVIGVMTHG